MYVLAALEPPKTDDDDPRQLAVDPEWTARRQRDARESRRRPDPSGVVSLPETRRPARSGGGGGLALPLVLIVATLGGAFWYFEIRPKTVVLHPTAPVEITIKAEPVVDVLLDGKPAGKTPLHIKMPSGIEPIEVSSKGGKHVSVVPDQDRVVDLSE